MSKNFAWLRIVTYINLVLLVGYLIYLLSQVSLYIFSSITTTLAFGLNFVMVLILLIHAIIVINIQRKYFPNKPLDPALKTWTDVFNVFGWIVVGVYFLGIIGIIIRLASYNSDYAEGQWLTMIILSCLALILVLNVLQLSGSRRLIKTIQRNHRQDFENSFL